MKKLIVLIFNLFLFQVNVGWAQIGNEIPNYKPTDLEWIAFGTAGYDYAKNLLQTTDGNFIVSGINSYETNGKEPFVWNFIKISKDFEVIVQKDYYIEYDINWNMYGIAGTVELADGSFMVGGSASYPTYNGILAKLTPELDTLWTKIITPEEISGGKGTILIIQLTADNDGNVIIVGVVNGQHKIFKVSGTDGEILWLKNLDAINYQAYTPLWLSNSGFSITIGEKILDFDSNGNLVNTTVFPLGSIEYREILSNNITIIKTEAFETPAYLVRVLPNGEIEYSKEWNGESFSYIKNAYNGLLMAITKDGGFTDGVLITRFDYYFNVLNEAWIGDMLSSNTLIDYEISKTDGSYIFLVQIEEGGPYGGLDYGIIKMEPFTEPINVNTIETMQVKVSPNPATDVVQISFSEIFSGTIEICNLQGQKVFDIQTENIQQTTIYISNLQAGFYILKTFNNQNNTTATTKFIVN